MTPSRIPLCSLLLILGTASGTAAATVPCFGGDEQYTADNLPATDPETGLPCRPPTAEELARRAEAWGATDAGAGSTPYPTPNTSIGAAPYGAATKGWSGQSNSPSNGGYGAAGSGSGYGGGYGGSQGYGSTQSGGIQGGSFKGRGQAQGGVTTNPYSSGKTFTKPPKPNVDASAFGGSNGNGNGTGSSWPEAGYETPAPAPSPY